MQQNARGEATPRKEPTESNGWDPFRSLEWDVAGWIVFLKLSLYLFAFAAVAALSNQYTPFWKLLNRWDALRYLEVARQGYVATGDARFNLVGLPLYPWLVRAFSWTGLDVSLSALLISAIASIAAAWCLLRLVRADADETQARLTVWYLFIFPTSYFLHIAYTEATLLALALGCFLAARRQAWLLCGALGGLAAMSRLSGLILLPAMVCEVARHYRATRRGDARWLWLALIPCGFGVYLWLNHHVAGDPLAFVRLMNQNFERTLAGPWTGALNLWDNLQSERPEDVIMVGAAEMFFVLLGLGMTIWSWCVLRASYSVWMTGNFLLGICSTFVLSVPRYTLVMFPIFILMARGTRTRPGLAAVISVWSILLLGLFFTKFVLGHWAF